jgi:hypothetical protein
VLRYFGYRPEPSRRLTIPSRLHQKYISPCTEGILGISEINRICDVLSVVNQRGCSGSKTLYTRRRLPLGFNLAHHSFTEIFVSKMPMSSSTTSGSSRPRALRKPASTTFLQSPSSPSAAPSTPASAGGGWKSIFRIPSSKRLNIAPVKENHFGNGQDDPASSAEHGSYHSSRSSGSDGRPHHIAQSPSTAQTYSPSSYKQAPSSPVIAPQRQKSGFLTRKLSSIRRVGPLTSQPSDTSFRQQQSGGYGNGISGGSPSIPPSPKSSMGGPASRLLRRVASAPNAKGLLNTLTPATTKNGLLAPSLEVPPLPKSSDNKNGSLETSSSQSSLRGGRPNRSLTASSVQRVGEPPARAPFRRTYSSNSMKHRAVEVRPSSFQKIKMLGRGDVGKVYLVREKKTDKLFAMKGATSLLHFQCADTLPSISLVQEGNDRSQQDQARTGGTRNSCICESPFHCHTLSFVSIGGLPLFLHGILSRRRIL